MSQRVAGHILALLVVPFLPSAGGAQSVCLNPFGCAPETRGECIKEVNASARTEAWARAALAECNRLPTVTQAKCSQAEKNWARHLRTADGAEWNFADRDLKRDCRTLYASTFKPALWVTPEYCAAHARKLAMTASEFSEGLELPNRLERFNRDNRYSFTAMDPWIVIAVLQRAHYPNVPLAEVADRMFIDSPPDQPQVAALCDTFGKGVAK